MLLGLGMALGEKLVDCGIPSGISCSVTGRETDWSMTAEPDLSKKVRENRLRRMAKRRGLVLTKSRRRDPRAYDFGGYMLVDFNGRVVAGTAPHDFALDLDDVESFLTG